MGDHKQLKQEYLDYRKVARRLYEDVGDVKSNHIKVPQHAPVQLVDGGAFVEAVIFITKEELDNERSKC